MQPPSLPPIPSVWPTTQSSSTQLQPPPSVRQLSFQEQRAATHIAEGILPLRQISLITGLSQARLLSLSGQDPDFQDRVSLLREEFAAQALSTGLALRHVRQQRLNDRAALLDRLIEERSLVADPGPSNRFYDPDADNVPGASTGLLVKTLRSVGSGPAAQVVDEWQLDRAPLRELADLEQQAAREAGQWRDVKVVESTTKAYIGIRIEDV